MKIAILGSNGFVGRNISNSMSQIHEVINVNRNNLNLLDYYQVRDWLKSTKIDVVICCAASMTDSLADVENNLGLYMNFYNNSDLFGKFINTASAAEYDRSRNIDLAREEEIWLRLPKDSYGLSQNLRSRLSWSNSKFYNLRIFNCFGSGEIATRIFPKFLSDEIEHFHIKNNRYFDYFSIQDLCKVTKYYSEHDVDDWAKDINCVYKEKYLINEVLEKFRQIHKINKEIIIDSTSLNNYTGNADKLNKLNIQLTGLHQGLENY